MSAMSARRVAFAHAQSANDSAATIWAETSSLALPDAMTSDTLTMSIKGPTRRERNRNKPRFTKTIVCDVKQAMADYAAQQAAEAQRAQSNANSVTQSAYTIVPPPSEAVLPSEEVSAPASIKTASALASTLDSSAVEATVAGSVETLAETPAKHLARRERNRNKPRFTKTMICDVKQAMANYAAQQAAEASKPVEADLSITDAVTSTDFSDEPLWHVSPIHIAPLHPETSIVSTIGTVGSALTCDNDSASSLNSLLEPDSPCTLTGELSSSPTYPISMPISPPVLTLDLDISDSLDPLGFFDLSIDLLVQPSATNGSNFSPSELSSVEFTTPSCPARGHASINVIGYADATEPAATLSLDSSASGPLVYPAAPAIDDSEVVRKLSDARPVVASASHVVYEDGSITKPTVAEPFFGYGIMIDVIPQPYGTTTVMNREYHIRMVPTLRQSKLMKSLCKAKRTLQKLGRLVCGRRY